MRHLAWLHAVPEKAKESRQKSIKATSEDSLLLVMPELGEAEYLVPLVMEAGLVEQSGTGIVALSWKEIESWQNVTGVKLHTWEATILRQMSEAYASEFSQASDRNRPAPYSKAIETEEIDREAVSNKLRNIFKSMKRE